MDKIALIDTLPDVFSDRHDLVSDVWMKDITFQRKQTYLIEAASGVGKSSLCSFIFGYRSDYSGSIRFDNLSIKEFSSEVWNTIRSKHISLLFQELRLFPELTAFENILIKNNLTHYKSNDSIHRMFEQLNIADKMDAKVEKLSWGQRQRVAVIRSLCQPFDFLILDEPISHLDEENAKLMAELIASESQMQDAGVIVTSIGKHLPLAYSQTFAL